MEHQDHPAPSLLAEFVVDVVLVLGLVALVIGAAFLFLAPVLMGDF